MTRECRLIENPELNDYGQVDTSKRKVGDMWYHMLTADQLAHAHSTKQYHEGAYQGTGSDKVWYPANRHRPPLLVRLPGNNIFLIDGQGYNQQQGYFDCWFVRGEPQESRSIRQ